MDPDRGFDDLILGERRRSDAFLLTEASVRAFAADYDPQWFHLDPVAAAASPFGGIIASGAQLIALWRRLDHAMNGDIAYVCGLGMEAVRFHAAVRPGDRLTLQSEIVGLRSSAGNADRGVATMAYEMREQADRVVLSLTAINLIYREPRAAATSSNSPL